MSRKVFAKFRHLGRFSRYSYERLFLSMKVTKTGDVNWKSLLTRLTAVAFGWFNNRGCRDDEAVLPGTGMSAKDLAFKARLEFIKNESKYQTKSDEDRFRIMVTIMRNDFFDLVKRLETKRTVFLDSAADGRGFENLPDPNSGFATAEAASVARSLYPLAEGERELIDLIDAVAIFGCRKREEIADLLAVSPQEITNRQKKLKYRRARRQRTISAKSVS